MLLIENIGTYLEILEYFFFLSWFSNFKFNSRSQDKNCYTRILIKAHLFNYKQFKIFFVIQKEIK